MINYADEIKRAVPARELFEHYGFEINRMSVRQRSAVCSTASAAFAVLGTVQRSRNGDLGIRDRRVSDRGDEETFPGRKGDNMKQSITITRRDNGFVLSVDGGSIECGTTAEVMSRVGHEMGMPFNKAQRQLFERMEAAEKVTRDLETENNALSHAASDLAKENATLKAAIVRCFIRAFKEG